MRKRTARETERQNRWQELVHQQREGGQSVRVFCRQAGIEESAFYWWRRKLKRRDEHCKVQPGDAGRPGEPAQPERRKPSNTLAGVRFLPVRVAAPGDAEAGCAIEIVLNGQRMLRIMPGFDRQTLRDVLGVLEGREC